MSDDRPIFGSLFAGIGGIDLGLERAGWRGRWQVEYEPFCQRVLAKHWPDVQRYGDIHDVDWSGVERVDLVAGGFPCQPFSVAGQRRGMDDDRWLWPEFERCLRALRPRYVLVENVPGLLVGRGMDAVLGGLADLGYDTEWESIPAAAVGAPHLRYRVWIIAHRQADASRSHADSIRSHRAGSVGEPFSDPIGDELRNEPVAIGGSVRPAVARDDGAARSLAHPNIQRRQGERISGLLDGLGTAFGNDADGRRGSLADADGSGLRAHERDDAEGQSDSARCGALGDSERLGPSRSREHVEPVHPASPGHRQADQPVDAGWWATEPDVGRVAHGVPARVDRLRALGNAVVPQVVEFIGRRILEAEALT